MGNAKNPFTDKMNGRNFYVDSLNGKDTVVKNTSNLVQVGSNYNQYNIHSWFY